MWVFPLAAAIVASVFAWTIGRRYVARRKPYELAWTIALVLYAVASLALAWGVAAGWTERVFDLYWAFGAVLTVPFLAGGEVMLLFDRPAVRWTVWLVLIFATAYTVAVLSGAATDPVALAEELPSGKDVFGDATAAHRLPQLVSYPSYALLIAGTLFSAWRMRGHPELRGRFVGTLLIALGATVVAAGSAFAATGVLVGFSLTLFLGITVMYGGFLRASRSG
jgi:hypothetical protein